MLAFLRILENPWDELSWFRVLLLCEGIGPRTARRVIEEIGVRRAAEATDDSAEAPPRDLAEPEPPQAGQEASPEAGPEPDAGAAEFRTPLRRFLESPPKVPAVSRELLTRLRTTLAHCVGLELAGHSVDTQATLERLAATPPLSAQVELVRRFYEPVFERTYENPKIRRATWQLNRSRRATVAGPVQHRLTLDPPPSTGPGRPPTR